MSIPNEHEEPKKGDEKPNENPTPQTFGTRFIAVLDTIFSLPTFLGLLLLFSFLFIFKLSEGDGASGIADINFARGLITLLFAVGTIAIALSLVFASIFQSKDENSKDRFDQGKEVLTILIGIFGTIVGFYYGSDKSNDNNPDKAPIVTSISPDQMHRDSSEQIFRIKGDHFSEDNLVLIDKNVLDPKYVSTSELELTITDISSYTEDKVSVKVLDTGKGLISKEIEISVEGN